MSRNPLRRCRFRSAFASACMIVAWATGSVPAQILAAHAGSSNPTGEGWTLRGQGSGSSASAASSAWRIDDPSTGSGSVLYYERGIAPGDVAASMQRGWRLRANLDVAAAGGIPARAVVVSYSTGAMSFTMVFGVSGSGSAVVRLVEGESGAGCPQVTGRDVEAGPSGFHQYELRFDPGSSTAELWIDGHFRYEGYTGHTAGAGHTAPGVVFGSVAGCEIGSAWYRSVHWSVDFPLPVVPGCVVEHYATVETPAQLDYDDRTDSIFVGRDGISTNVRISRIGPGAGVVEEFGPAFFDPDGIAVDETGAVSGVVGAVLVANGLANFTGEVRAVRPDGTSFAVVGPTAVMQNPNALAIDSAGRLIIADDFGATNNTGPVFTFANAVLSTLFVDPVRHGSGALAVDASDTISSLDVVGTVRRYASNGALLNGSFVVGLGGYTAIGIGPAVPPFAGRLVAVSPGTGTMVAVDTNGVQSVVGTGFGASLSTGMTVGSDGSLYVSRYTEDRVLRIAPTVIQPRLPIARGASNPVLVRSPSDGGLPYVFGLALSPSPGIPLLDGRTIPLAFDALLALSLDPLSGIVADAAGQLDPSGSAVVTVTVPAFSGPPLTVFAAFVTLDAGGPSGVRTISESKVILVP